MCSVTNAVRTAVQIGGVLQHLLDKLRGLGVPKQCPLTAIRTGFGLAIRIVRFPKGPKIEKVQSRLTISISLEMFNPDLENSPQKLGGLVGGSLEISNLA